MSNLLIPQHDSSKQVFKGFLSRESGPRISSYIISSAGSDFFADLTAGVIKPLILLPLINSLHESLQLSTISNSKQNLILFSVCVSVTQSNMLSFLIAYQVSLAHDGEKVS